MNVRLCPADVHGISTTASTKLLPACSSDPWHINRELLPQTTRRSPNKREVIEVRLMTRCKKATELQVGRGFTWQDPPQTRLCRWVHSATRALHHADIDSGKAKSGSQRKSDIFFNLTHISQHVNKLFSSSPCSGTVGTKGHPPTLFLRKLHT